MQVLLFQRVDSLFFVRKAQVGVLECLIELGAAGLLRMQHGSDVL